MSLPFADRAEAGRLLAQRLMDKQMDEQLPPPRVVVALPRGGVPVAAEVARRLDAPLDLLIVRKIGAPWQRELAVAAIADGESPERVVDEATSEATGANAAYIDREAQVEWREIERRRAVYLQGRAPLPLTGATVILVDDGIATGTSVRAALQALRRRGPTKIVLAVPVAAHESLLALRSLCDGIVCLAEPQPFRAVGLHYRDFHQVSDAEVIDALASASRAGQAKPSPAGRAT